MRHIRFAFFLLVSASLLVACGSSEEETKIDYAAYTDKELEQLYESGKTDEVFNIVRERRHLGAAKASDFLLTSRIFLDQMKGELAEEELQKAKDKGANEAEISVLLARAYLLQGKIDKIAQVFEGDVTEELSKDDQFSQKLIEATVAAQEKDKEKLHNLLDEAIKISPEKLEGYAGRISIAIQEKDEATAVRLLEEAKKSVEEDSMLWFFEGAILRRQGKIAEARLALEKSLSMELENAYSLLEITELLLAEGEIAEAEKYVDTIFTLAPESFFAKYFMAHILFTKNEYAKSENLYAQIQSSLAGYAPAARSYGLLSFAMGKYERATRFLRRAVLSVPNDRIARLALTNSLRRTGYFKEALHTLEPLLESENDFGALMEAGDLALQQGDRKAAQKYISRLIDLSKDVPDRGGEIAIRLQTRLAILEAQAEGLTLDARISKLESAYANTPQDMLLLVTLGNARLSARDFDGASDIAMKMTEFAPNAPYGPTLEGTIAFTKREYETAVSAYTKALEIAPSDISNLKNRGRAYLALQRHDDAVVDLSAYVTKAPRDGEAHRIYGRALLGTGEIEKALNTLYEAERLMPDSVMVQADLLAAQSANQKYSQALRTAVKARKQAEERQYSELVAWLDKEVLVLKEREAEQQAEKLIKQKEADLAYEKARAERKAARDAATAQAEKERAETKAKKAAEDDEGDN